MARDDARRLARRVSPSGPSSLPHALPQGSGDVGQRMLRVFRSLPPGPAIIVGSDIPDLAPEHVARGFAALGRADNGAGACARTAATG